MIVFVLAIFHYYIFHCGFLAYIFIFKEKRKISVADYIVILGVISLTLMQLFDKNAISVIIDLRFYWGWLLFYFIFKQKAISKEWIVGMIVFLSILTIAEAISINTFIHPWSLPNYPSLKAGIGEYVKEGMYQRPYSFGASATVSSSLLVVLIALANLTGWQLVLSIFAVLIVTSGTGIVSLIVLLVVRYKWFLMRIFIPFTLSLLLVGKIIPDITMGIVERIVLKVGFEYIALIAYHKMAQFGVAFHHIDPFMLLCGDPTGFRGGDFGLLAFVLSNGLIGSALFLILLISRLNSSNRFPLFLIIISTLHYPVMFYLPGQMIFGFLLSLRKRCGLPSNRSNAKMLNILNYTYKGK